MAVAGFQLTLYYAFLHGIQAQHMHDGMRAQHRSALYELSAIQDTTSLPKFEIKIPMLHLNNIAMQHFF